MKVTCLKRYRIWLRFANFTTPRNIRANTKLFCFVYDFVETCTDVSTRVTTSWNKKLKDARINYRLCVNYDSDNSLRASLPSVFFDRLRSGQVASVSTRPSAMNDLQYELRMCTIKFKLLHTKNVFTRPLSRTSNIVRTNMTNFKETLLSYRKTYYDF